MLIFFMTSNLKMLDWFLHGPITENYHTLSIRWFRKNALYFINNKILFILMKILF